MRKLCVRAAIALCIAGVGISCATHEAAKPRSTLSPTESTKEIDTVPGHDTLAAPLRKLPRPHIDMSTDPYPEEGKRQHLQGRVLLEFQLDQTGKAVSLKVLQAEAAPALQKAALNLVRRAKFDVSNSNFDAADPTPFRVTIRFCLPACGAITSFPGSEELTIAGGPL